jgi:mono/diheme cytochrome c family protein|tara:strand:+ start:2092 stop:2733 length:642 start_codon:yes stop_codon:yes gene_type:complete
MKMQKLYPLIAISLMLMIASCTSDPNSPGIEYMPDMYRSPAVEAYVDYGEDPYYVTEEFASTQRNTMSARLPAAGSIAYKGDDKAFALPYPYPNTPEGYEAAGVNLHSPLVTSDENTAAGAIIFTQMCTQCHGEEGKGDGAISRNGHIAGIPDYATKLKDLTEGKMYHTLQFGKGLMGSHASQLSQKERWLVIEYIKVLQGNDNESSETENNN